MGKWVKSLLGAIGPITKGSGISRDQSHSGELPAVRYGEIYTHHNEYVKDYVSRISNEVAETAQPTHRGDILFAGSGETPDDIGKCVALLDDGVFAGGDLVIFSPPDGSDPVYWGCLLNIPYVQKQKAMRAQGSSIYHIRPDAIKKIEVVYDSDADEQRHIAEILTTCDEVIEKSEAVAEKYRAIKSGMLKDLFTRGIGRNGKLRPTPESAPQLYKDTALGKVPREWEVKMLGDDDVSCVNPSSQQLPERFVYVDLESVESGKLLHENEIERGTAPSRAQRVVADGDILYQLVRPYQKNNLLFRRRGRLEYVASTGYAQIRAKHDARFLYQYLYEEAFLNRVLCLCTGTGYPAITPCNLSGIFIKVPDPAEQRQIAERLSAIDAKIADELAVIAKYRKVKAGLMARLLTPPPDVEIVDGGVE